MVSHHEVTRDAAEFALQRMVRVVATIFPLAALIQVLANRHDYRQPAVAVAVWLIMFPVAAWLVPRIRADGLTRGEAAVAIMIATAAVAVMDWEHRTPSAGQVGLAILGTVWLLAVVALSNPARIWIPGALIVYTVHAVLLIGTVGANRLSLTQLEAAAYILVGVLIVFAALRPTIDTHTSIAARGARLASKSVAERAAAAAVQEDRRDRLALLEIDALPLLRGIADGTLDPAADHVRERCAQHAAALRHSLSDRAPSTDGLLPGLEPALRAASARGLLVDIQVIGDPGSPGPEVAHAVLATVDAVLGALPPHQVMLTVIASRDDVELYLTFSEPPRVPLDAAAGGPGQFNTARWGRDIPPELNWHATVADDETGTGCLEIGWRKAVLLDRRH